MICGIMGANTGKPQCDIPIGAIKYTMPTRGAEFTKDQLVDSNAVKAALLAKMLLAKSNTSKVFTIPYANEAANNTGEAPTASLSDGFEKVLTDPLPKYNLTHAELGRAQNQAICQFNGWNDKLYFVDRNNRLAYIIKPDGGGKGFSVGNLYYPPPIPGSSNALNTTVGKLTFANPDEFKLSPIGLIQLDFNVADLVNIEDVTVVQKAAPATNVFTVGLIGRFTGIDAHPAYASALANMARWVVKRLDTGASMTLTSAASDSGNLGWDITVDSTEFTNLPSGTKLSINIADPTTLALASVYGIEGTEIIYTK